MEPVAKWMKLVLLVAGVVGGIGFYQPFYEYRGLEISPYRMVTGYRAEEVGLQNDPIRLRELNDTVMRENIIAYRGFTVEKKTRANTVPYLFAGAAIWLLVGLGAIVVGRFGFTAALFTLAGSLLALGGYMREYKWQRDLIRDGEPSILASSSTLLLVTGLVALAASLVALIWRDPGRPKKPPPARTVEIPEARVVSR